MPWFFLLYFLNSWQYRWQNSNLIDTWRKYFEFVVAVSGEIFVWYYGAPWHWDKVLVHTQISWDHVWYVTHCLRFNETEVIGTRWNFKSACLSNKGDNVSASILSHACNALRSMHGTLLRLTEHVNPSDAGIGIRRYEDAQFHISHLGSW